MHTAHPLDKETVRSKLTYAQIMGMRRKPANLCSNHGDATKQAGGKSITTEDEAPSANPQTKKQRVPKLRRGKESPPKKKRREWKGERRWCSGESFSTFSCLLPSVPPPVQWGRVVVRGHRKQPPFSSSSTLLFPRRRSPP